MIERERQINIEDFDDPYVERRQASERYKENLNKQISETRKADDQDEKKKARDHINRLRVELDAKSEIENNRVSQIRKAEKKKPLEQRIQEDLEFKRKRKMQP